MEASKAKMETSVDAAKKAKKEAAKAAVAAARTKGVVPVGTKVTIPMEARGSAGLAPETSDDDDEIDTDPVSFVAPPGESGATPVPFVAAGGMPVEPVHVDVDESEKAQDLYAEFQLIKTWAPSDTVTSVADWAAYKEKQARGADAMLKLAQSRSEFGSAQNVFGVSSETWAKMHSDAKKMLYELARDEEATDRTSSEVMKNLGSKIDVMGTLAIGLQDIIEKKGGQMQQMRKREEDLRSELAYVTSRAVTSEQDAAIKEETVDLLAGALRTATRKRQRMNEDIEELIGKMTAGSDVVFSHDTAESVKQEYRVLYPISSSGRIDNPLGEAAIIIESDTHVYMYVDRLSTFGAELYMQQVSSIEGALLDTDMIRKTAEMNKMKPADYARVYVLMQPVMVSISRANLAVGVSLNTTTGVRDEAKKVGDVWVGGILIQRGGTMTRIRMRDVATIDRDYPLSVFLVIAAWSADTDAGRDQVLQTLTARARAMENAMMSTRAIREQLQKERTELPRRRTRASGQYHTGMFFPPGKMGYVPPGERVRPATLLTRMRKTWDALRPNTVYPTVFTKDTLGYIPHVVADDGSVVIPGGWVHAKMLRHAKDGQAGTWYKGEMPDAIPPGMQATTNMSARIVKRLERISGERYRKTIDSINSSIKALRGDRE